MAVIGILGHGTVGSGVVEVLLKNGSGIEKKTGTVLTVKKIFDRKSFPDLPYRHLFTKDAGEVLDDPEIDIVVETMGGLEPAFSYTKWALESGKFVVTSNKELVAEYGPLLQKIAHQHHVEYFFEASVGGGIPIIRPLKQCLAANNIYEITGILNGTTNFILTEMCKNGKDFESALFDAQARGYAERDPSADICGFDAQRKIAILSSIAFGQKVLYTDINTEGISGITKEDMLSAEELGYVIKLVAHAARTEDGIYAMVSPIMLPLGHPLADVEDVFNAVLVKGDAIGDVMFYGKGAGKYPTASAVIGDIIEAANYQPNSSGNAIMPDEVSATVLDSDQFAHKFFLRLKLKDAKGFEKEIATCMQDAKVHIFKNPLLAGEAGVFTGARKESELPLIRDTLASLDNTAAVLNVFKVSE
ncbi:MAG TPA: homoserine dehydrogenase [Candidatus Atribacteria bacterium]|nr:homoserine dehydrogenase [Candidatus Atribacteria bacterium]